MGSASGEEPVYEVVWPLGRFVTQPVELAPGLTDLNGKTVAELWDWAFRGDQMYSILNEELRKRYPGITILDHKTLGTTHGVSAKKFVADLPELLRAHGCDAVISAVGA